MKVVTRQSGQCHVGETRQDGNGLKGISKVGKATHAWRVSGKYEISEGQT